MSDEPEICVDTGEPCWPTPCRKGRRTNCEHRVRMREQADADFARRGDPARFTLYGHRFIGDPSDPSMALPEADPPLKLNEVLRVREDRITDSDIEKVAQWLHASDYREISSKMYADARDLLALVLGGES